MRGLILIGALVLLGGVARAQVLEQDPARAALAEAFRPYTDQTIVDMQIICDVEACSRPERISLLRRITRLRVGGPLRVDEVIGAWDRLGRTRLFRRVQVLPVADPGGVIVRFVTQGAVTITSLEVGYADSSSALYPRFFITEIRKRLFFKQGGAFPPRRADGSYSVEDQQLIDRQKAQVVALYAQQGYLGTSVDIKAEYHGKDNKSARVRIVVDEGKQPELGQVLLSGNESVDYSEVLRPVDTGEWVDFWRGVFRNFGVGSYERRALKEQLALVEQRYREKGWVSARVRQTGLAHKGSVVFPLVRVYEGPKVVVRFEGNESLDPDLLQSTVTFAATGAYDETAMAETAEAIVDLYQTIARYFAQVTHQSVREDAKNVTVTFTIKEGPRVYVRKVHISGNMRISTETLTDLMETKGVAEDGVISALDASDGVLQDARMQNDLTAVRELYADRGMPGLRFRCSDGRETPEVWTQMSELRGTTGDDSMLDPELFRGRYDIWSADPVTSHCFRVVADEDPRLVNVYVELEEGLQTTVGRLEIDPFLDGLEPDVRDEAEGLLINRGFRDERGNWRRTGLNRSKIQAVQLFMQRYFQKQGYLQAKVTPICVGEEAGSNPQDDCTEAMLYGRHLDSITFTSDLGPRTLVDGILTRGNLQTDRDVMDDELLMKDGEPLGTEELFISQAHLRSLGIFDSVSVETIGGADGRADEKRAAVVVTVEEGDYKLFDGYVGVQVESASLEANELPVLYTVGFNVRDRNFLGRALELGAGANHANRIDAPQDIEGDDAAWEGGPYLNDRRFFGTRLELILDVTGKLGRTAERDAYERVIGGGAKLSYDFFNMSYPATWGQGLRATLGFEVDREERRQFTRRGERPPFSDANTSFTIVPSMVWDRRDSPLHPTRGWLVNLITSALITRTEDLTSPAFKQVISGQYVQSFFNRQLIAVPLLRLGAVQTTQRDDDLPSGFLFKAGGDGVTTPVRGYGDAEVDACHGVLTEGYCTTVFADDDDAREFPLSVGGRAMVSGSLEVRFPTYVFDDFWFAAFTDVAAVAPSFGDLSSDSFYPSVGGGLRWLVTGQIPLRLDVGVPLRATGLGPQQARVHLNIFYTL